MSFTHTHTHTHTHTIQGITSEKVNQLGFKCSVMKAKLILNTHTHTHTHTQF